MSPYLAMVEVSQKQAYIFNSIQLKQNITRSDAIARVTSAGYFDEVCKACYKEENMVYSGGGHTVLEFSGESEAKSFISVMTSAAMRDYPDMEVFATISKYDGSRSPGENLKELTKKLEIKKAARDAAFRQGSFGVERLNPESLKLEPVNKSEDTTGQPALSITENTFGDYTLPTDFKELTGKDNFIAVIHIDGNQMGKRVEAIYNDVKDWDECKKRLRNFSEGIAEDFEAAVNGTIERVRDSFERPHDNSESGLFEQLGLGDGILPIRKVIGAGDDICLVTAGSIGLECAAECLRLLHGKKNREDGALYSACAGVAIVHTKYPFHRAYELSEALCSNAKRFASTLSADEPVSAIDWHIEFGQLKDGLDSIRGDYISADGGIMNLRPLAVVGGAGEKWRRYSVFRAITCKLTEKDCELPRSKLKGIRESIKTGSYATQRFIRMNSIGDLLYVGAESLDEGDYNDQMRQTISEGGLDKAPFRKCADDKRHCLYFDSIEIMDHFIPLKKGDGQNAE